MLIRVKMAMERMEEERTEVKVRFPLFYNISKCSLFVFVTDRFEIVQQLYLVGELYGSLKLFNTYCRVN